MAVSKDTTAQTLHVIYVFCSIVIRTQATVVSLSLTNNMLNKNPGNWYPCTTIFILIWHSLLLRIYLPFANFTSESDSIETSSLFRMRVPLRQGSVWRLLETYNLIDANTSPSQRLSRTQGGNRLLWRQNFMHTQAAVWVPHTHTHMHRHTHTHTVFTHGASV